MYYNIIEKFYLIITRRPRKELPFILTKLEKNMEYIPKTIYCPRCKRKVGGVGRPVYYECDCCGLQEMSQTNCVPRRHRANRSK